LAHTRFYKLYSQIPEGLRRRSSPNLVAADLRL
jgi:hypothetical protein